MKVEHHNVSDIQKINEWNRLRIDIFKPEQIRILLVGESPPNPKTGKFFYEGGPLTKHIKKVFECQYDSIQDLTDSDFLKCFKKLGCYLDDVSLRRVDGMNDSERNYTVLSEVNDFIDRLMGYRPNAVITILKRIDFFVKYSVEQAGLDLQPDILPFPGYGGVAGFIEGLSDILAREIQRGNLPKEFQSG